MPQGAWWEGGARKLRLWKNKRRPSSAFCSTGDEELAPRLLLPRFRLCLTAMVESVMESRYVFCQDGLHPLKPWAKIKSILPFERKMCRRDLCVNSENSRQGCVSMGSCAKPVLPSPRMPFFSPPQAATPPGFTDLHSAQHLPVSSSKSVGSSKWHLF